MTSIITEAAKAARTGTDRGLREALDFLITQEQLSTTFLTAAIERAEGTPSAAFLPVLRNAVTAEFHHVEALEKAGGQPLTAKYWLPDAAFDNGGVGLFSTADDLALYARMILAGGELGGERILSAEAIAAMTAPYDVSRGVRGLGWDKQSPYSINRGDGMTEAAIGHGGFTGTAMWIDPGLELAVIFLSSRLHPDGEGTVNPLIGEIGTAAVDAVTHP